MPFFLFVVVIMACQSISTPAQAGDETGIEGTVLLGPIKPGPTTMGQDEKAEAPLSTSFSVFAGDTEVGRFQSDREGRFRLALPPGDYTIVPASTTPIPRPEKQVTKVSVPSEGFATITIRLATGML